MLLKIKQIESSSIINTENITILEKINNEFLNHPEINTYSICFYKEIPDETNN